MRGLPPYHINALVYLLGHLNRVADRVLENKVGGVYGCGCSGRVVSMDVVVVIEKYY